MPKLDHAAKVATIKSHRQADPDGRGYSGMSNAAFVADINTPRHSGRHKLDAKSLLNWSSGGALKRIEDNVDHASEQIASICRAVVKMVSPGIGGSYELDLRQLNNGLPTCSVDQPGNKSGPHEAAVDALVSQSILTAAEKAQLLALSGIQISDAEKLFDEPVSLAEVREAARA